MIAQSIKLNPNSGHDKTIAKTLTIFMLDMFSQALENGSLAQMHNGIVIMEKRKDPEEIGGYSVCLLLILIWTRKYKLKF